MEKLGTIELSSDILKKANIGLWAFELDEGQEPRMYVDDAMLGLIGLDHQVSPEETYHAWYDHIDENSYGLVADAVEKMTSEHAEVQYPWHHPDGRTMIVRCGGVRNPEYTKGIRVEGTHQNVTEVLHFQSEGARRDKDIIEILASEYSSVYYIDLTTDGLTPYTMNEITKSAFGKIFRSDITYSEAFRLYVDEMVSPEDREMMLDAGSIMNIVKELRDKKTFITIYRDSENRYCEMKFVKVGGEEDEPLAVALGFSDRNDEIRAEMMQEQEKQMNFDIIEILASEYSSVYYIDLTTDGLTPYTMNAETETTFGSVFRSGITYSEAYRLYVDKLVFSEDKPMMLKAGSIGNIMKELRSQKTFLTTFRNADGHYSEMKFVKVGNEEGLPAAVALGFADKDAELRAKEEESRILQRNIDIIEILASEYSSVYYIDLTTDELDPYTMNEETETEFGSIFRSGIKYSDAFRMYVDTLVYEEDRERMLNAGSRYNILKELSTKKTFITTYRSDNEGDPHYCEMKFVKVGDDENPTAVALGFADKDKEIRDSLERNLATERDMAVISGLSDDFGCVVYVNYDTDEEIQYRFDPLFEKCIPGWSSITNFTTRLRTLVDTVMHPDDKSAFWAATRPDVVKKALARDNVYYVNFRAIMDGEVTYYQAKFVRDENTDSHVIAGFHNVDEETKREMEALKRAEAANAAKTTFLFNMSHDIRTPMNAIIGFTNMAMKQCDGNERALDSLNKVKMSSDMLLSLINDILDMSRIESGKVELNLTDADLAHVFEEIEPMMGELAAAKNIDLSFGISSMPDSYVELDVARTNRVLVNIISNAIKYTQEGGQVRVLAKQLEEKTDGYGLYSFIVADNGIGMSEEFQKHMFDEFAREVSSTNSGIQGTGLGLTLAKALVDLMHGKITCQSRHGVGTIFTVTLPLRIRQRGEEKRSVDYMFGDDFTLAGKNVLLAEDNELNREIAVDILEEQGMVVTTAVDGNDALDKLKRFSPEYFDFILMDIQMPFMDGYEATREIRRQFPKSAIPIIALSANAFEEDKKKSIAAGMNDHIAKPINVQSLFEALKKFNT